MKVKIIFLIIFLTNILIAIEFGSKAASDPETVLELQIENDLAERIQKFLLPLVGQSLADVDLQLEYPQLISEFYGIKTDEKQSLPGLPVSKSTNFHDNFGLENRKDLAKIISKNINIILSEKIKEDKRKEIETLLEDWLKIDPDHDMLLIQYHKLMSNDNQPDYTIIFILLIILTFFATLMIKSGFRYLGSSLKKVRISDFGNILHIKGDMGNQRATSNPIGLNGLNINQKQPLPITIIEHSKPENDLLDFTFLENLSEMNFIQLINNETPEDIALMLSKLDPHYSSRIFSMLKDDAKEIMDSLIKSEPKSQKNVNSLRQKIFNKYSKFEENKDYKFAGNETLISIINNSSAKESLAIFEELKFKDNTLAVDIREKIFLLEDIIDLDDNVIKALMKTLHHDLMVKFIANNNERYQEKFFKNMTKRSISIIQEDIEMCIQCKENDKYESTNEMLMTVRIVLNFT